MRKAIAATPIYVVVAVLLWAGFGRGKTIPEASSVTRAPAAVAGAAAKKHPFKPPPPAPPRAFPIPAKHTLRVLVVGDSLAYGLGASKQDDGFKWLVERRLAAAHAVVDVPPTITLGADGLTYVRSVKSLPAAVDVAVLELGTSDANQATPPAEFRRAYAALVAEVRRGSPRVALVCLGPWGPADATRARYGALVRDACARGTYVALDGIYDAAAARGPAGRATWSGPGGTFHPNDTGHRLIADAVVRALAGA